MRAMRLTTSFWQCRQRMRASFFLGGGGSSWNSSCAQCFDRGISDARRVMVGDGGENGGGVGRG